MPILRTAAQICDHGFALPEQLPGLEAVAARYTVALPHRVDPADRSQRSGRSDRAQFVPDIAELDHRPDERADPIGDDAHSAGRRHRASLSRPRAAQADACLRGLLPLLLPPRNGRAGQGQTLVTAKRSTPRSPISATHPEIWEVILTGGDPLVLSARRLARRDAGARRHRPRQGRPHSHPRAGRRSREQITADLVRAMKDQRQGHLCRASTSIIRAN